MKPITLRSFSTAWMLMIMCTAAPPADAEIIVNSLQDSPTPGPGEITLRRALETAADGEPIVFAAELDGGTIELSVIGAEHTVLKGEVMGFDYTNNISYLIGYFERDYGRSALYSTNDVVIDASALSNGITVAWPAANTNNARILAVYGDLSLNNVSITGGHSVSHTNVAAVGGHEQHTTRGRGGGLAVWGTARLESCRVYSNACSATAMDPGRDAGLFGGGIYADVLQISNCIISANSVTGVGVSGGGVFSVGGAGSDATESALERSTLSGNVIAGIFAYGAGVYSDGGGIGNLKTLRLENCTIAENLVDLYSGAPFLYGSGYWRGGGVYMSNGRLVMRSCTVVNNHVNGAPRELELSKANLAGGVAATIGNAHAAESMTIGHSIITGNTVQEYRGERYNEDVYTGSLLHFFSEGHNRIGIINFDQILVPVGEAHWKSLCRKHYPKQGDRENILLRDAVDITYGSVRSSRIRSRGVNAGQPVVLYYKPWLASIDQIPASSYTVAHTLAEYWIPSVFTTDNFPAILLGRLENHYGMPDFASTFTADFEAFLSAVDTDDTREGLQPYTQPDGTPILTLADTLWFGPDATWPSKTENYPYIEFWHRLDGALKEAGIEGMGSALLDDAAWQELFDPGLLSENAGILFSSSEAHAVVTPATVDQSGMIRPANGLSDIGAIEYHPEPDPLLRMEGGHSADKEFLLRWNGYPASSYTVWSTSSLTSEWTKAAEHITNALPFNVYTGAFQHAHRFFQVEKE